MKESLSIGAIAELSTVVGAEQSITLANNPSATVFATPSMINLMEYAAREALQPHLDADEESVGIDVNITHTSATPPQSIVTAQAEVTAIEKKVVSFSISAKDRWGQIGHGTHRRAIINTEKFVHHLNSEKSMLSDHEGFDLANLETLKCRLSQGILHVSLNRPRKRNAINPAMTRELEGLVNWLETHPNEVRLVTISGSQGAFCAGDDVGELSTDANECTLISLRRGALYAKMTTLPQPIIAAIEGPTLGGGLILAAACDFRIAGHSATFGLPEASLGWPPNYGLGILQSLLGRGQTLALALTGQTIDARRADSLGLINKLVSPYQLEQEVSALTEHLISMPPQALAATKRILNPQSAWSDVQATREFTECLKTKVAQSNIVRFRDRA